MLIEQLKTTLSAKLKAKDFNHPDSDFVQYVMSFIGHPDDTLRDDLVYPYLDSIIHALPDDSPLLVTLLNPCLANLYEGVGTINDTVFIRTFSMLIVAEIVKKHLYKPYLNQATLEHILSTAIDAHQQDIDCRGYIEGKGWAHGVAHAADLWLALAKVDTMTAKHHAQLLEIIRIKIMNNNDGYDHNEDKRLARPTAAIIAAGKLSTTTINTWLASLKNIIGEPHQKQVAQSNVRNFLCCLHVFCDHDPALQTLIDQFV